MQSTSGESLTARAPLLQEWNGFLTHP